LDPSVARRTLVGKMLISACTSSLAVISQVFLNSLASYSTTPLPANRHLLP
jgi:hypothetical protein